VLDVGISPRLQELDKLVRAARLEVLDPDADPEAVELFEALAALTPLESKYADLCEEAGYDAEIDLTLLARLMVDMGQRVVAADMRDERFASYTTLVMARAVAEVSQARIADLGVRVKRVLGVNPFDDE